MSGLGRAWVRTNVRTAKRLLAELQDLTSEERAYLDRIIADGEQFLRLTRTEYLGHDILKRYE